MTLANKLFCRQTHEIATYLSNIHHFTHSIQFYRSPRHPIKHTARFILCNRQSPFGVQMFHPRRPIIPHPRKQNTNRSGTVMFGCRMEHGVNRRTIHLIRGFWL
jgi:hypothetical protein